MNIYEITKGEYSAKINLSRGGNCISLRNNKYKARILREPDYSGSLDNPYLYGMPILFPVNRISGGSFMFEGREYVFPINEPNTGCHIHGTIHEQEFRVVSGGEDYVICSYRATREEAFFGGQNEFEITISYYLNDDGLVQETTIKNLSLQNMPIMLGFHTTFLIPFMEEQNAEDLRILADVSDLIERNRETYLPTGNIFLPDDLTLKLQQGEFPPFFKQISRHYKAQGENRIEIRDIAKGICVQYENSAIYKFRLLYNGKANEYICLEPQNCLVNCMNEDFDKDYAGFQFLKPNEEITFVSRIGVNPKGNASVFC